MFHVLIFHVAAFEFQCSTELKLMVIFCLQCCMKHPLMLWWDFLRLEMMFTLNLNVVVGFFTVRNDVYIELFFHVFF
jgi:hypothetical protein